jgi:hypothetical protein
MEKYRAGMITDDHLVVESLISLDPENPGLVLSPLPDKILNRALRFADEYLQGRMVTNYGDLPARGHVLAARDWLANFLHQPAPKDGIGMSIVVSDPRIVGIEITKDAIVARLTDCRAISVPLAWSWRLTDARPNSASVMRSSATATACIGPPSMKTSASEACCTACRQAGPR